MTAEAVKIDSGSVRKLLGAANPDAALLYIFISSGNQPEAAEEALRISGSRLSVATATLRQLGLWPEERKSIIQPGELPAYSGGDVLEAMEADSGIRLSALKVDGGASANNFLMETQADLIQAPVHRPVCVETTAMGAAYLAGLAVGYWKNRDEIRENWQIGASFAPEMDEEGRKKLLKGWHRAVKCALAWAEDDA